MFFLINTLLLLVNASTFFSVLNKSGDYSVVPGRFGNACATGYYDDLVNTTGWGKLYIRSNFKLSEEQQAYCSGYLEGYLTHHEMFLYWDNYCKNEYSNGEPSETLKAAMQSQLDFFISESETNTTEYWKRQKIIKNQFFGLFDGYVANVNSGEELTELDIYMLNSVGDLENLNTLYKTGEEPLTSIVALKQLHPDWVFHECSALVKNVDDEIYFGHATWRSYYAMLRIYKVYDFYYSRRIHLSFSSSPGLIHSKDDYYTVISDDSELYVMETTNSVEDLTLFESIEDKLLSWQRILSGMYFEKTAQEFVETIKHYNSGTYNNQWIVFDVLQWKSSKSNSLYICEQMPGLMKSHDVTDYLISQEDQFMWPSYNIPYDPEIYTLSGYDDQVNEYTNCSRAQIFKRDGGNVVDLDSMKYIMRYNDYENDEFSLGDPKESIASRYDLRDSNYAAFGAIDAKIVQMSNPHVTHAISGPTYQNQPVFEWNDKFTNPHEGVPVTFDFDWVEMEDQQN